jgi:predicted metal-dependent HD superfamily phosphohydrolase
MTALFREKVEKLVERWFGNFDTSLLTYHCYGHTLEVSNNVRQYAEDIFKEAADWLYISGLFHDTGYLHAYHNHEEKSMELAEHFLKIMKVPYEEISFVTKCIESTKLGVSAFFPEAALLKDTDLAYGVTEKFKERGPLLRKEWELNLNNHYADKEWEELQFNFLNTLSFESDFGRQYFIPKVKENLLFQTEILANF